jgi:purine-cytosine permease-like protein
MAATTTPTKPAGTPTRRFGKWTDNAMLEDYSLRYAPRSFRTWSSLVVASAALGGIAYLVDFAIGASIAVSAGFTNAILAILLAAVTIFITGIPIAYYSAKYHIDMDLLTRGAGFGYLGSTLTSLIYASFTFIFFALEGAVMGQALTLFLGIPLWLSYLIAAIGIIPLVIFGMTLLAKFQLWTQVIWLVLFAAPFVAILVQDPGVFSAFTSFGGESPSGSAFSLIAFGTSAGIALSLIAQIGEQVDYLRFMPDKTEENSRSWWAAVLSAGPGWVVLGAIKQIGGAFLAFYVITRTGAADELGLEPITQYVEGFNTIFANDFLALAVATFLVVLSQVKINVTNAYAGSLAWSNFFSRVAHRHPGRVVWVVFNVAVALVLMEVGVFDLLATVLGFYSNVAIAWLGAVVADLVIIKPLLKVSPSYIEFKRAHLYSINPVGFVSMIVASVVSLLAFFGFFGELLGAFSPYLALTIAFVLAPIIAVVTKGRYYIARGGSNSELLEHGNHAAAAVEETCVVCGQDYEKPDMAGCPFHSGAICSLCCTLERSCHDVCKQPGDEEAHPSRLAAVLAKGG